MLNKTCLGVAWLRVVMAFMVNVDALFGILNSTVPSFSDAVYGSRFCGHGVMEDIRVVGEYCWLCHVLSIYNKIF